MEGKQEDSNGEGAATTVISSDGSPLRSIFCLKRKVDMKKFEEIEDCFILDFDPYFDSLHCITDLHDHDHDHDLSVIAQKGQVACRDYPHSRHLCFKFPFHTTPHESCCELCYCYVCDSVAPCKYWKDSNSGHCHASEHIGDWKFQRNLMRNGNQLPPPTLHC